MINHKNESPENKGRLLIQGSKKSLTKGGSLKSGERGAS